MLYWEDACGEGLRTLSSGLFCNLLLLPLLRVVLDFGLVVVVFLRSGVFCVVWEPSGFRESLLIEGPFKSAEPFAKSLVIGEPSGFRESLLIEASFNSLVIAEPCRALLLGDPVEAVVLVVLLAGPLAASPSSSRIVF